MLELDILGKNWQSAIRVLPKVNRSVSPPEKLRHFGRSAKQEPLYSCKRSLSLDATRLRVWLFKTPRYRARPELWIVASLCRRSVDTVLRLVPRNSGSAGSISRSEGRSRLGTTEEM